MNTAAAIATLAINQKSAGIAIVLSLLFTGAGQWYVGRVGRGFAFLGAAFVSGLLCLVVIGFILLPIVYIWAAIDANKLANEHNAALLAQTTGVVPGRLA
jgi:TM2 domain-containing membrane protein YozV